MHRGKIECGKVWNNDCFSVPFLQTMTHSQLAHLVVTTFWSLGLIAFGGPAAHVAILREHLVVRRDWISEEQFMELFAIGQVW